MMLMVVAENVSMEVAGEGKTEDQKRPLVFILNLFRTLRRFVPPFSPKRVPEAGGCDTPSMTLTANERRSITPPTVYLFPW